MAEQVFEIKDRTAGDNFPPFHPWCRCTFTIEVDDWDKWMDYYVEKYGNRQKAILLADRLSPDDDIKYRNKIKDFERTAKQFQNELADIIARKSLWSGKIIISDDVNDNIAGKTDWSGDIRIRENADETTILHEILHTYSALHMHEELFFKNKLMGIEEATVSYFAENYMKQKGKPYHKSYEELMDVLYRVNRKLHLYRSDLDFATALINIPIDSRYDWLHEKIKTAMIKEGASIRDINAVIKYIDDKLRGYNNV